MKALIFGNNSFKTHKRGIENVILTQIELYSKYQIYYLHWGNCNSIYKYNNLICISIKNTIFWPFILNRILFRIKKVNLVHSHNPLFSFLSIKQTNIFTLHDGLYYFAKSQKNKKYILFYFIELLLYLRVNKIHFISKFSKNESLFWGRKKNVVIYNSSHLENLTESKSNNQIIPGYFLIVKSIEERARIDLIIDIAKKYKNEQFIIVGKGPYFNFYNKKIQKDNISNVKMLGFVEDSILITLYKNSKCVINIAQYGEGFGLPIIEAYLFNKPVLASNNCAIPEIIYDKSHLFENTLEGISNRIDQINDTSFNSKKIFEEYYWNNFSKQNILGLTKKFLDI